ncbi:outer membrane lipoprotein carrier protein LolA [Streptomyces sp. NPDC001678]|uniref:LolA family protein n=1 Tax=Streptomyces sp. NPDC001678 TaxID=3364599 RepID=UPI00369A209D
MAENQPTPEAQDFEGPARRRRKAVRYAVPVAVAGVAAATIGIGSALASTGDPDLPKISAQDLIAKMAQSDTQRMSGSIKINTDLGLPSLPSGLSFGDGDKKGEGKKDGSAPSPQSKLTELAAGSHTLRLAVDGPDKQRVSIVERAAEYSVVRNGADVWAYDSAGNTVHHSKAPEAQRDHGKDAKDAKGDVLPKDLGGASPQELAKKVLAAADGTTAVTVDGTAKVAGRDAYQLLIKPKADDTTVGSIRIAVDAKNGVPLKFTLAPKGGGKAVVDAAFTKVDFGKPGAGTFDFTPPKGAKVTEGDAEKPKADHKADHQGGLPGMLGMPGADGAAAGKSKVIGKGWSSIAEFDAGKDASAALNGKDAGAGKKKAGGKGGADAQTLLDGFGTKVSGDFGSGRVYSTRIVNVLMTDDGKVYAGAVTKDALVKAANAKQHAK